MALRIATAAVALGLVCPASADTKISVQLPKLALGAATRANIDVARIEIDREHGVARLSLTLSSREATAHAGSVVLDLPRGARVTGLAVTIGHGHSVAIARAASEASALFKTISEYSRDPALVEQVGADRVAVRVFPLVKSTPAMVELVLDVSEPFFVGTSIAIEGGRAVAVARQSWLTQDTAEREHVSATTSLFAGEPIAVPTIHFCTGPRVDQGPDKTTIRTFMKLRLPRLSYCYTKELLHTPTLQGTAILHFSIDRHGRAFDINVDGTLMSSAVSECLEEEVSTWRFSAGDYTTRVHYPLSFRLSSL